MTAQELGDRIVALAWIRCLMEEGVDFVSATTGVAEKSELAVLDDWSNQRGEFSVPKANAKPAWLEKNIYEVVGNFLLKEPTADILNILMSRDFRSHLIAKINLMRQKDKV